mmetsp:Transcript_29254/g.32374  ORF Transcript_29254/g.32374 Transcript_29254/m.32374 type:complete len:185 (-) Transcript_29254:199-753(-)
MDKCDIIRQISEQKLQEEKQVLQRKKSKGSTIQKKIKQKKRSKSSFKQPSSYRGTSCSTIYVQPPSFGKGSCCDKDTNNTLQKKKTTPRFDGLQDKDAIGTDLPIVPFEKRRCSMNSVTTATTISSEVSWISSSSSYCQTGSNIYNSISEAGVSFGIKNEEDDFCTDDASVATTGSFVNMPTIN